ncbi:hypothetical protein COX69_03895 [Candidatus Falkowbacteria bacterium CG_4_10_14_0_2_um_filter_48_10]|uniref:beta-fructofuranosidase n=1 Tax=Candidatus Falkowbacteria bacterium CG23_combo_of_CG06-09_8_20_14_all_49_15 TaxID=1974572 RepID=A0A2G9ZLJ8_9BACT|nr:MAG: hypothetical protein COX22_01115 [Candidatus Falkowbacteria bacterium CG23_combo_of_CG06-09_8_20_14_all_49_15]PJA07753.1 MAG: hypothetical protein COX69_03895 [Candidatus Falkowbacteria bacterium CG_4_10_14_0_2_um_filter_48_10]
MTKIIEEARTKALAVLRACRRPTGFFASGLPGGYEAVWARDSQMTALGASLQGEQFKRTIGQSLTLLARHQGAMGQIPNCVGSYNTDRQSDVTYNSVDSSLWFIIGHYVYARAFRDRALLDRQNRQINMAFFWLKAQDPDNLGLLVQQPTNDWQDAFPHKYGYTIHCLSLFYAVLKIMGEKKQAESLRAIVNGQEKKYASLYDAKLGYYYPWAWKNHDTIREHEEWFDTAGNLLAILTGLADKKISDRLLDFIEKKAIDRPFPCQTIWPPLYPADPAWHDYFALSDAREPYNYLNAGIWPFIGGLYVAALAKTGRHQKAAVALEKLAQANLQVIKNPQSPAYIIPVGQKNKIAGPELLALRQKEFNEWLHGRTGEPRGEPYQGWSAGLYLYAYECVKQKKVIYF